MKIDKFEELESQIPSMKLWRNFNTSEVLDKQAKRKNKHVISKELQTKSLPVFHSYKPTSLIEI